MAIPAYMPSDQKLAERVETCTFCMKMCRFACPVAEASKSETHTPFAKMQGYFHAVVSGKGSKLDFIDSESQIDLAYLCTNCGLCNAHCKHENQVEENLTYIRHRLHSQKKVPLNVSQAAQRVYQKIDELKVYYHTTVTSKIKKDERVAFKDMRAGQAVFVPDLFAFKDKYRRSLKIQKRLSARWPEIKILEEALDIPFLCYQAGDFSQAISQIRNVMQKANEGITFVFESEQAFFSYSGLAEKLQAEFSNHKHIHLAMNEINLEIKLRKFQFQAGSVALRLWPQPYVKKLKFNYANMISSLPEQEFQQPVSDSLLFSEIFEEISRKMLKNKWHELIDREGHIVCATYSDFKALQESKEKSFNRSVYYYYDFL